MINVSVGVVNYSFLLYYTLYSWFHCHINFSITLFKVIKLLRVKTYTRTTTMVNKIYYRLDVIKNITANNNSFILYMILTKVDQNNECSNNCIRHGDTMFLLEVTIKDTFNFNRHVSSCLS